MSKSSPVLPPKELWAAICAELAELVSADAVTRWFAPLHVEAVSGATLTLRATNSIYQYWVEENYLPQLKSVAGRLLQQKNLKIKFAAPAESAAPKASPAGPVESVPLTGSLFPDDGKTPAESPWPWPNRPRRPA